MAHDPGHSSSGAAPPPPSSSLSSFVRRARAAAEDVKEAANGCKLSSLRDEGHSIALRALDILSHIEARGAGGVQRAPHAAQLVHEALAQVQGRLVTASRECKGGFLSKFKASLDTSHKKSFKEAHDKLQAALSALDPALDVMHSDQQQQQQQHSASARAAAAGNAADSSQLQLRQGVGVGVDGDMALHLRWDRGNAVVGVGLVTTGMQGGKPNLWVGLRSQTEFYPGCGSIRTHSQAVDRGQAVTCIVCDHSNNCVWTGHADGTIMLHADATWGVAKYRTQVGVAVRALAVDLRHDCWAGDEAGVVYMLHSDRGSPRIVLRKVDVPPPAAKIWAHAAGTSASRSSSGGGAPGVPVAALLGRGSAMVSSGGYDRNYLTLWNSQRCEKVEHCNTQSYGPALSLATVAWQEQLPADAAAAYDARLLGAAAELAGWRLLSGHDSGQVLVWQVQGLQARHGTSAIVPVCIILEPRQLSPLRHIACFEDYNMMVLADTSGVLAVTHAPTPAQVAEVAAATPPSVFPGAPARPRWLPRFARIRAHKSALVAAASAEEVLLTASAATVKSWTADQLKLEAQGDGVMFSRSSRSLTASSSTLSTAATAAIAANAVAAAYNQQPQLQPRYSGHSGLSATDTDPSHLSSHGENMASGGSGSTKDTAAAAAAAAAAGGPPPNAALARDGSGASAAAASGRGGPGQLQQQQQQQQLPARELSAAPSMAAAAGGGAGGAPASEPASNSTSSRQVAASSGRFLAASASKPNPFSRAAVEARGMVVGPNNRVVPAILRGLPQHEADALQQAVAPVMQMLTAQWQHPGLAPMYYMGQPMRGGSLSHGLGGYLPQEASGMLAGGAGGGGGGGGGDLDGGNNNNGGGLTEAGSIKPCDAIRTEHIITCEELELNQPIGIGAEGKVYRGKWCNIDIAAKEYLAVEDNESAEQMVDGQPTEAAKQRAQNALLKEVGLLGKLMHPNLVRFCGVCLDPPLVVMEYYRFGSVYKMLENARAAVAQGRTNRCVSYLSWKRRLDMLHDVASGMMYLHSRRYVHGDLRSPNLFVTEHGRVKIGDFGFTKRLKRSKETIKVGRITHPRWVAPELLNAYELSTSADVYSFGIIMYEVLTFKIPFEECAKAMVAIQVLAKEMRPQIPSFEKLPPNTSRICLANYIRLMEACWAQDPKKRPSFSTVARRLKAMQRWYWACTNALRYSSTTLKWQAARSNSAGGGNKGGEVPMAVAPQAAAAAAVGSAAAAAAGAGAGVPAHGDAAAAFGKGGAAPPAPALGSGAMAAAAAGQHNQQQLQQLQQHPAAAGGAALLVGEEHHDDAPPPLPEPADLVAAAAAAAKAAGAKKVAEPSVQVCMVDDKPLVCIDMGEGKPDLQAVEEKLLAEMQSITKKQGEAVAQQAQFIIVGADLPAHRTLSAISESVLPQPSAQLEGGGASGGGVVAGATPAAATASRGLASGAGAAAMAGAAAAAAASALPSPPRPIKVRPGSPSAAAGASGDIDAYVRDASAADTHDKVQDWLKAGTGSSELPPGVLQLQEPAASQGLQQQQQQEAAVQQQQERQPQERPDVFSAEDSPFFLAPTCVSSGSVELGAFRQGGAGHNSSMQNALDDSTLPAADGSGAALSEAPTIFYPEECSPAQALMQSTASIRSASITSSAPTLWNMAGPAAAAAAQQQQQLQSQPRARALPGEGSSSLNPYSFTATEASPFACNGPLQDDDEPLPAAAADDAPAAGGATSGQRNQPATDRRVSQADSNSLSAGPFGVQQPAAVSAEDDGVVRDGGAFGGAFGGGAFGPALGAAGVNEDSVALPLPDDDQHGGGGLGPLQQQGGDAAAAAAAAGGPQQQRASPPPSPGPGSSRTSGAGSGVVVVSAGQGQFGPPAGAGQQYHHQQQHQQHAAFMQQQQGGGQMMMMPPVSPKAFMHAGKGGGLPLGGARISGSPRYASPAPQQGAAFGAGAAAAAAAAARAQGADVRRWSSSSRASSAAGAGGGGAPPQAAAGYPQHFDNTMQQAGGGFLGGAGAGGAPDPAAAAGAAAAGILHKPLDDSVLNKNLFKALGRTATQDLNEEEIDVVDMQQRDLQAWQSQNRTAAAAAANGGGGGGSVRRSSCGNQAPVPAGAGWHAPPAGTAGPGVGGGFLPAEGLKGWVPGMVPPEAVLHQGGGGGGGPPPPPAMHHPDAAAAAGGPMHMPGWGGAGGDGSGLPYGAAAGGIGARGRIPSGPDSSMGWGGGGMPPGPGTSPPNSAHALGGVYHHAGGGTMQAAAYMQMQAAAAANVTQGGPPSGGAGSWFPPMHNTGGGYPPVGQQPQQQYAQQQYPQQHQQQYAQQQYAQQYQQQQQYAQQQQYQQQQQYAQQQQYQQQQQQQQYMYKQQQNRGM